MKSIISDMDGVLYRGRESVQGAKEFVAMLLNTSVKFLFLTNNSEQTPLDLMRKLSSMGIEGLSEKHFMTSVLATATFIQSQKPNGSAYVIGGGGLVSELYKVGYAISESDPDYVIVGKTTHFNFEMMKKATNLIRNGAKFIATNPDVIDPTEHGIEPACGSILASIEKASGKRPYVVGKPNALMMSIALNKLGVSAADAVMIGDRMDTDIQAGLEAGMTTCLVLSGVTDRQTLDEYPYKPNYIVNHVGEIDRHNL